MPRWTPEQQAAIKGRDASLLVSAAAGAGKTAVLVARVLDQVLSASGTTLDRLLVVTFTDAAALEMRERIAAALDQVRMQRPNDMRIRRQLALIDRAPISTLHAFCHALLRRFYYRLGLDPAFEVMDGAEARLLQLEVVDDVLRAGYDSGDPAFVDLALRYGGDRGDEGLKRIVLQLAAFADSQVWPEAWLNRAVARFHAIALGGDTAAIEATDWWPVLVKRIRRVIEAARQEIALALAVAHHPDGPGHYVPALQSDWVQVAELEAAAQIGSWEALSKAFTNLHFVALSRKGSDLVDPDRQAEVKARRKTWQSLLRREQEELFGRGKSQWLADLAALAPPMQALASLVQTFRDTYKQRKLERAQLDFSDLERYVFNLLVSAPRVDREPQPHAGPRVDEGEAELTPSDVAWQLRSEFDEVLVDEYQDINPLQDAILSLLSGGQPGSETRLFMVGDIKQSIYRFRLADPTLFANRYRSYGTCGPHRRIDLSQNFRCRPGVVAVVNYLFERVLTPETGEVGYGPAMRLVAGAQYPEHPKALPGSTPAELVLISGSEEYDASMTVDNGENELPPEENDSNLEEDGSEDPLESTRIEREAAVIAKRIVQMVGGDGQEPEFWVFDKAKADYRPVSYRDIVILMRSLAGQASIYVEVLQRAGIPVYTDLGTGLTQSVEVRTLLALLQIIDNPRQDIPLAAVLHSPLVGLSAEALAQIRLVDRQGDYYRAVQKAAHALAAEWVQPLRAFLQQLERWRDRARRGPVGDLIRTILHETGYQAYLAGLPGGEQRAANVRALVDRARQFDRFSRQGLHRFLRFVEDVAESDQDLGSAPAVGEGENAVRIMSVHKSKGLEFPVVIVAGLGKQFNLTDQNSAFLNDRQLGFGPRFVDPHERLWRPSLAQLAVREAMRAGELAEEMRVLYVALTRARERLILVGTTRDLAGNLVRWRQMGMAPASPSTPESDQPHSLSDAMLASARSYLDWVVPALAQHPDVAPTLERYAQITQGLSGHTPFGDTELVQTDVAAPNTETELPRWHVYCMTAREADGVLASLQSQMAQNDHRDILAVMAQGRPLPNEYQALLADQKPDALVVQLSQRFAWRYPYEVACRIAAKSTVTALNDSEPALATRLADEMDPVGTLFTPVDRSRLAHLPRPRFLQASGERMRSTEIGLAMHKVLQHLQLGGALDRGAITLQVDELVARDILRPEEAEVIDVEGLVRFFAHPVGRRMARAKWVVRELPFTMRVIPYPDLPTEFVVVQGVIDCLFRENGDFVLLDFKTDRHPSQALIHAYREQVGHYCRAVAALYRFGRVREAYLCFLSTGQVLPVLTAESMEARRKA